MHLASLVGSWPCTCWRPCLRHAWHSGCLTCKRCRCLPQALIGNYAVPILDEKQVWGTTDETRTAYLDSLVRLPQAAGLLCPAPTVRSAAQPHNRDS